MAAYNRCGDCAYWTPGTGGRWGTCCKALNGGMFLNHLRDGVRYMARHTNTRYYTTRACKRRFVRRDDNGIGNHLETLPVLRTAADS